MARPLPAQYDSPGVLTSPAASDSLRSPQESVQHDALEVLHASSPDLQLKSNSGQDEEVDAAVEEALEMVVEEPERGSAGDDRLKPGQVIKLR